GAAFFLFFLASGHCGTVALADDATATATGASVELACLASAAGAAMPVNMCVACRLALCTANRVCFESDAVEHSAVENCCLPAQLDCVHGRRLVCPAVRMHRVTVVPRQRHVVRWHHLSQVSRRHVVPRVCVSLESLPCGQNIVPSFVYLILC